MITWLRETGSPNSKITKLQLKNEKEITKYDFSNFEFRK
jgi:hypothetical protein